MKAELSVPLIVAFLDGIEDAVIFISVSGNIFFRNRSATEALGIESEKEIPLDQWAEAYGFYLPETTTPFPTKRLLVERVLRSGAKSRSLLWQKRTATSPGTLWLITAQPFRARDAASNGVLLHFRDLSAPYYREARLQESLDRLRDNREALETFTHMVSHDLREPLRTIQAFTTLLNQRHHDALSEEAKGYLELIAAGAGRMHGLVEGLLAYLRAGGPPAKMSPTKLEVIVGQTLKNLALLIRENAAVIQVEALPTVTIDGRQLAHVFQNLIENAIKYRGTAPPHVRISASREQERWIICVADNGVGIAPEDQQRIFRPFYRLEETGNTRGTGMGLSIVSRIIESHGGKVRVESQPGSGARFYLELPVSSAE